MVIPLPMQSLNPAPAVHCFHLRSRWLPDISISIERFTSNERRILPTRRMIAEIKQVLVTTTHATVTTGGSAAVKPNFVCTTPTL